MAQGQEASSNLIDQYEYVMHGKIFEDDLKDDDLTIYISFGGLLLQISGKNKDLKDLELDSRIYLLMKKIG